jgi:hypothetical protein
MHSHSDRAVGIVHAPFCTAKQGNRRHRHAVTSERVTRGHEYLGEPGESLAPGNLVTLFTLDREPIFRHQT